MFKLIVIFAVFVLIGAVLLELAGLARLGLNLRSYATYWNKQLSADSGEIVYVALGDSAAQGIGAGQPEKGYTGLLARHIEQKTGKSVRIVNLSRSGAKIGDVLTTQIPLIGLYKPDVITVEIGANDLIHFDKTKFNKQFAELAAKLPAQTVVATMPNFGGRIKRPEAVAQANEIVASAAKEHGLAVANLYEVTKSRESIRNYAPDWFHPNDRGYRNWEAAFWSALEPKLNQL